MKFIVFFSWATLIFISTLTTKQHYLWDVIAAIVISYGIFRLAEYWLCKSNNNKENDNELEIPNTAQ
jgi:membrane-associated phospholipid phosphatase